jgi:hypothetical protein
MKLYPRQIKSIDELRKEQQLIRNQLEEIQSVSFQELKEVIDKNTLSFSNPKGLFTSLKQFFSSDSPSIIHEITSLLPLLFSFLSNKKNKQDSTQNIPDEILNSYLKWKVVVWVFKTVSSVFKKKK